MNQHVKKKKSNKPTTTHTPPKKNPTPNPQTLSAKPNSVPLIPENSHMWAKGWQSSWAAFEFHLHISGTCLRKSALKPWMPRVTEVPSSLFSSSQFLSTNQRKLLLIPTTEDLSPGNHTLPCGEEGQDCSVDMGQWQRCFFSVWSSQGCTWSTATSASGLPSKRRMWEN